MIERIRIAIGSDHAGFELKESVRRYLASHGYVVEDCGVHSEQPADYPDSAEKVAVRVSSHAVDRGVLICGTGLGMAIAANKVTGVRAATCNNTLLARLAGEHNDANILTMGGRIVSEAEAQRILDAWLGAAFAGGRHQERVQKITKIEEEQTLLKQAPQS